MKKYIFFVLFIFCVTLVTCQNSQSFGVWDYTIDSLPDEQTMMFKYFSAIQHNLPSVIFLDVEPKGKIINDTLFYTLTDEDTIYVYNTISYQVRTIPIKRDIMTIGGINTIYYHNHDSIFVFYQSSYIQNPPQWVKERNIKLYDLMLINGQGDIIGTYMLDHPFKQNTNGKKNNILTINCNLIIGNRLYGDDLLINFWTSPTCFSKEYAAFDPPIAALYNLKTGKWRMLNIHFPSEYFGKTYGNNNIYENCWLLTGKENDLYIFFQFSPTIYHYDFQKDTMTKWNCKYDNVFTTTDSASMKYGKMILNYDVPRWCHGEQCYFRAIGINEYKDYKQGTIITEILDSNFNHLAYAIDKKTNYNPYSTVGIPVVYCHKDQQSHQIHFNRKLKKIKMKDFEKNMIKKPVPLKDSIGVAEYFRRLNIPDKRSVVLISNMKYPCSTCYDFIFGTMKYNSVPFENKHIYYICYDPNGTDLMNTYLGKYNLGNSKNIFTDTTMLGSVYDELYRCFGNYPYILVQYLDNGKYILEFPEFQTLYTIWKQLITDQIEWENKKE